MTARCRPVGSGIRSVSVGGSPRGGRKTVHPKRELHSLGHRGPGWHWPLWRTSCPSLTVDESRSPGVGRKTVQPRASRISSWVGRASLYASACLAVELGCHLRLHEASQATSSLSASRLCGGRAEGGLCRAALCRLKSTGPGLHRHTRLGCNSHHGGFGFVTGLTRAF